VKQQAPWFDAVFSTDEQRKHFREYVTGLIAGNEATVTAINDLFLERNDQSALNKFLTQAEWDETELNRQRVQMELARLYRRPVRAEAGRLAIDDTLAHHTRCRMDWLAYLWDHAQGRYAWAHDVVTSYYVNRSDQFPVNLRHWYQFQVKKERAKLRQMAEVSTSQQTLEGYRQYLVDLLVFGIRQQLYRTKTTLAADLVLDAVALHVPFSVVTFDGWFLHNELIDQIEALGKDWIGGCPKDRLVWVNDRWVQLQDYLKTIPPVAYRPTQIHDHLYWTFTKVLKFKSLNHRRVRVVASFDNPDSKGEPFLLTSNGQPRLSTKTSRGTWALKIISCTSSAVSGVTGTCALQRILFSVTKATRDDLVTESMHRSSRRGSGVERSQMNCWAIWSSGSSSVHRRVSQQLLLFKRCWLDRLDSHSVPCARRT